MKIGKEWLSISDMMTGLMIIFLFISVIYIQQSLKHVEEIDKAIKKYIKYKTLIYNDLKKEFNEDLKIWDENKNEFDKDPKKWDAELVKDSLIIRFLSPQIMFNPGEIIIKPGFKKILSDFCPRYLNLLHKFNFIDEIRIEGHTSSEWEGLSPDEAYFKNMALSQNRARSVLKYCFEIVRHNPKIKKWAIERLTANGLSSSRPICKEDTVRCRARNRRVAFRVQIKSIELEIDKK